MLDKLENKINFFDLIAIGNNNFNDCHKKTRRHFLITNESCSKSRKLPNTKDKRIILIVFC